MSITMTAPTCLTPLTTCLSHCCHKPHGRLRGHPMRRMVRMKMLVMRKRCYVSAELPQQRCSGAWALVQGCRWMWGRWRRWFHRCGPVWRGPGPAASPSASPPWRQKCLAPRRGRSLHIWGEHTNKTRVREFEPLHTKNAPHKYFHYRLTCRFYLWLLD